MTSIASISVGSLAHAVATAAAEALPVPALPGAALVQERMKSCQGLVRSIAWSIGRKVPPHVEMEDLIAYGQVGLAQAARDFDAGRGNRFTTYAFYRVRGAIYDGLSRMSWFRWSDYHGSKYEQMANELMEVATEPSQGSEQTLEGDARWFSETSDSLAVCYLAGEAGLGVGEQQCDPGMAPESLAVRKELVDHLRRFISELPSDARLLITSLYYDGLTLTEAGKRLGVSKSWASRMHAKTLGRLGRAMRLIGLEQ